MDLGSSPVAGIEGDTPAADDTVAAFDDTGQAEEVVVMAAREHRERTGFAGIVGTRSEQDGLV